MTTSSFASSYTPTLLPHESLPGTSTGPFYDINATANQQTGNFRQWLYDSDFLVVKKGAGKQRKKAQQPPPMPAEGTSLDTMPCFFDALLITTLVFALSSMFIYSNPSLDGQWSLARDGR
jgi:hypothetical protein